MKIAIKKTICFAAALAMAAGIISGCTGKEDNEAVNLKWYFIGTPGLQGSDEVYKAASELVKKDLGFTVDFIPLETGSYADKMKFIISSGEDFDICWTSNWLNDYVQNVANGAFVPLDELLESTPKLKGVLPQQIWDGAKIDGKIYAVPSQQIMARSSCVAVPKEYYEKYGKSLDDAKSYTDLTDYMAEFAKDHPEKSTVTFGWNDLVYSMGFEEILGAGIPGAVSLEGDEKDIKVYNQYATEDFKRLIDIRKEWTEKGYTVKGAQNSAPGSKFNPELLPFQVITYKPGLEAALTSSNECDMVTKQISDAYLTRSGVTATMNAINTASKHKQEAIKLLEYINTTPELINMLTYGLEDKNYVKVDENKIKKIQGQEYSNYEWVFGNVFNTYLLDGQENTVWEDTKQMNNDARVSRLIAFTPETKDISLEINNCKSVIDEYMSDFNNGFGDTDTKYGEMLNKLEAAGVNKVIEKLQQQIDTWLEKQ